MYPYSTTSILVTVYKQLTSLLLGRLSNRFLRIGSGLSSHQMKILTIMNLALAFLIFIYYDMHLSSSYLCCYFYASLPNMLLP